jgi:AcrR family transcriptional regulator
MGLREQKRLERRKEILLAAAQVFKERGYDQTRMDQIATRAEVSPGTVYNHFATKDILLLELAALYRAEAERSRLPFVDNPPADPIKAFSALYSNMIDQALRYFDRKVWRHVLVAGILGPWDVARENWWSNEKQMIADQKRLLHNLKRRKSLPPDLNESMWAQIIHAVGLFFWERFVSRDDVKVRDLKKTINAHLRCILSAGCLGISSATSPVVRESTKHRFRTTGARVRSSQGER